MLKDFLKGQIIGEVISKDRFSLVSFGYYFLFGFIGVTWSGVVFMMTELVDKKIAKAEIFFLGADVFALIRINLDVVGFISGGIHLIGFWNKFEKVPSCPKGVLELGLSGMF